MVYGHFTYFVEFIFSISMFMSAVLFASQAIKIYKTKSAKGLSIMTFLGFNVIQILAISHAYLYHDYKYVWHYAGICVLRSYLFPHMAI